MMTFFINDWLIWWIIVWLSFGWLMVWRSGGYWCAVQRSCRRRRRNARWSTTSSMPRSPNSPASRQPLRRRPPSSCILFSHSLRHCGALCHRLSTNLVSSLQSILSLLGPVFLRTILGPSTIPAASRLCLYFTQKRYFLFLLFIFWTLEKRVVCLAVLKRFSVERLSILSVDRSISFPSHSVVR